MFLRVIQVPFSMFNIMCWNARGLGIPVKRRFLRDFLVNNEVDLLGVQETQKF